MPYFRQWIEEGVKDGSTRLLPEPIEISEHPENLPWLSSEGDVAMAHAQDPFGHPQRKVCNLKELLIR